MSDSGISSTPYYELLRPKVAALEEAFYSLLEAADAYAYALDASVTKLDGGDDAELLRRLRHQRREVAAVISSVEEEPMAALLRIIDRVVMIRHTEEGRFV